MCEIQELTHLCVMTHTVVFKIKCMCAHVCDVASFSHSNPLLSPLLSPKWTHVTAHLCQIQWKAEWKWPFSHKCGLFHHQKPCYVAHNGHVRPAIGRKVPKCCAQRPAYKAKGHVYGPVKWPFTVQMPLFKGQTHCKTTVLREKLTTFSPKLRTFWEKKR